MPAFPAPPLAVRPRAAAKLLTAWRGAADAATQAAFDALAAAAPGLSESLAAIFEGSPFLRDLTGRDPARFVRVLGAEPDQALSALLDRLPAEADRETDEAGLMRALRLARQEVALLTALADLRGLWDVAAVTSALTRFADLAVQLALRFVLRREAGRSRISLLDEAEPERDCGYFIIGMGKLGAGELNFSSDIDLVCFYEAGRVRCRDPDEHQAVFVRVTQGLAKLLNERTYDGVVFRVDLRLRPDPGTYPLAISTALALHYYEAMGQTWERAAFIKARPVAGDIAEGERFLAELRPFVFRRYLDFASIADVHAMKRQNHAVKGHAAIAVAGHDLKLGRGGIREVEFFVQTQQLIGAGRDPRLRSRGTVETLAALEAAGWIAAGARAELAAAYEALRALEHRVQMVADEQTHRLPEDPDGLAAFARFAGVARRDGFARSLSDVLRRVETHYAALFEEPADGDGARRLSFAGVEPHPETVAALGVMGFEAPAAAFETVRGWLAGRLPATRAPAARERLAELLPRLIEALAATGRPDAALLAFDRCVSRLPAGVQLFSLLRSNPQLLDLVMLVLGAAPRMAETLTRRPHVLDGLIEALHAPAAETSQTLDRRVTALLSEAASFEDALDRARIVAQEQKFLIGVRVLAGTLPIARAATAYSAAAEAILRDLHGRVTAEIERRHGRTPRGGCAVVAMGKLGSAEMTATSDLDLLLLYEDAFDAMSDGDKPLYASEYYTRLTQRLVAALSAPTAEGAAYAVDFRLRPSGNKGPLATSIAAFVDYHEREAWTWEHMALSRARVVSAPPAFAARIEAAIAAAVRRPRDPKTLTADMLDMRRLLLAEKPPADDWDVKQSPGGQIDCEFLAQWLTLRHANAHPALHARATGAVFEAAGAAGVLSRADADALGAATRFYDALTQMLRLALDERFDPAAARPLAALVARAVGAPDLKRVEAELLERRANVRRIAKRLWGAAPWGENSG